MTHPHVPLRIYLSKPVGIAATVGGALMVLLALAAAFAAKHWVPIFFEIYQQQSATSSETPFGLYVLIILGALSILYYFAAGLGEFLVGLRRVLRPTLNTAGPEPFFDYNGELIPALQEGKLKFFGSLSARLRVIFGENIVALPPTARDIVIQNGNALIQRAITIPLLGLSLLLVVYNQIDEALIFPLGLLIVGSILQGAVEYFTSNLLVPDSPRLARSHQASRHYKGFGHPTHLFNRVPILGEALELPGFPNRIYRWGEQEKSGTVRDVGEFTGAIFIERQPEIVEADNTSSGLGLLLVGWLFRIVAAGLVFFLFTPPAISLHMSGIAAFLAIFAAARFHTKGTQLKNQGVTLLDTLRFRSIALLLGVKGELSRADVQVGRGQTDSLSSQNVAARSNFTAQFWTAELISEARNLQERRRLIEALPTHGSQVWLNHFQESIESLREERIRPLGLEVASPEANELINANQAIFARRADAARGAFENGPGMTGSFEQPPLLLTDMSQKAAPSSAATPNSAVPEATKECPECAEKIRTRAKLCRYCGHRFDDENLIHERSTLD